MIDHLGIRVSDYERSRAFYALALAPLGYRVLKEYGRYGGLGEGNKPDFWLGEGQPAPSVHVAFAARDRATVDAFYAAAIAAGGSDNGAPGLRPQYHANYYGAFVRDPDGYNIEVVCHAPA